MAKNDLGGATANGGLLHQADSTPGETGVPITVIPSGSDHLDGVVDPVRQSDDGGVVLATAANPDGKPAEVGIVDVATKPKVEDESSGVEVAKAEELSGAAAPGVGPKDQEPSSDVIYLQKLVEALASGSGLPPDASAKALLELPKLVCLEELLERAGAPSVTYRQAAYAARLLQSKSDASIGAARAIIQGLTYRLSANAPIYLVLRGLAISASLMFALFVVGFLIFTAVLYFAHPADSFYAATLTVYSSMSSNLLVVGAFFGLLGSIVSVLTRVNDFESSRRSAQFLLMSGFILPIIGVIYATVAGAMLMSHFISFGFLDGTAAAPERNIAFMIVLGFAAGFSERLMRGLLDSFDGSVVEDGGGKNGPLAKGGNRRPVTAL
jgi:hypothetical protein